MNTAIDSWGFTEADHLELRALMLKHQELLLDVMRYLHQHGIRAEPDDPGMMGWLAQALPDVETRVFPHGGFHRALLDELRALDNEHST